MIYINDEQKEKFLYLSKIFNGMSVEELKTLSEREDIVEKLKGNSSQVPIIMDALNEIQNLQVEVLSLKSDITTMVKMICSPYQNYGQYSYDQQNVQNLKQKYGIYN